MSHSSALQCFELPNTLKIVENSQHLTKIEISNDYAEAEIYLHGGHLTHFQPHHEEAVIFDAKNSRITPPKSAHFGIPICWPWFGPHPTDSDKPQHGFARDLPWSLKSTKALDSGETEVVLSLQESLESKKLFPYHFELELVFHIGRYLSIALTTTNTDSRTFSITQALHSYFSVANVDSITIEGVEKRPFIDYTDHNTEKSEKEPLIINQEINRVYQPTIATCCIIDRQLQRKIIVEKRGSNSTTIWNPWRESGIHDLPDNQYEHFVCIETTNALDDARELLPQEKHTIKQIISTTTL